MELNLLRSRFIIHVSLNLRLDSNKNVYLSICHYAFLLVKGLYDQNISIVLW